MPYYIFTGDGGRGFVIISADDVARPVLGYSADAALTPDGELPVPMEEWLTSMGKQIRQAQEDGVQQSADVAAQWRAAAMSDLVVKLQTAEWGQGFPYNNSCPMYWGNRCVAGCVPVAYAILMKYYKYPQVGRGSTREYFTKTQGILVPSMSLEHPYDWDNMPMSYTGEGCTSEQLENLATLLADVGAAMQVDYNIGNTNGYLGLDALFTNFDYYPGTVRLKDACSSDEWADLMRAEIDKQRPVVYRADNEQGSGHVFLLDGYTDDGYFSVNWGWYGNYNGLFTLDALSPGADSYVSGHVAYLNTVPMPMSDAPCEVRMNGRDYPTLTSAVDAAPRDGTPATIILLADIQGGTYQIQKDCDVTVNVGDHHIDMQFGFANYGHLTLKGTEESLLTTRDNIGIVSNYGVLDIVGGRYKQISTMIGQSDYRRCVWTAEGSETRISDVTFEAPGQVVCTNGNMTIESGTFTCTGNSGVVSNFSTSGVLTINGGTFLNNYCDVVYGTDYRRGLWTSENSKTVIGHASFTCEKGNQTLCFNGDATINGAVIDNEDGIGCLAFKKASIVIEDCRFRAPTLFYTDYSSKITCRGGLYSSDVYSEYLADGYECVSNTQAETNKDYPFMVQGIGTDMVLVSPQKPQSAEHIYDIRGVLQPSLQPGVNLIRYSDGTVRKVLNR